MQRESQGTHGVLNATDKEAEIVIDLHDTPPEVVRAVTSRRVKVMKEKFLKRT